MTDAEKKRLANFIKSENLRRENSTLGKNQKAISQQINKYFSEKRIK